MFFVFFKCRNPDEGLHISVTYIGHLHFLGLISCDRNIIINVVAQTEMKVKIISETGQLGSV